MRSSRTVKLVSIGLLLLMAYCIAIVRQAMQTSVQSRHSQCVALWTQKSDCQLRQSLFVRTKGLEPPRLSASDPKSDVATNYTMSAGSRTPVNQRVCSMFLSSSGAKVKTFCNIHNIITLFRIIFSIFVS